MPRSYLWAVVVVAVETLAALVPLRRPRPLASLSFALGYLINELPFVALAWVLGSTLLALGRGDLGSPGGLAVLGLAVVTTGGLVVVARRGLRAGPAVAHALHRDLGRDLGPPRRRSLARILLAPVPLWRHDVQRIANLAYGDAGRRNRLDLYRRRSPAPATGRPVLIHFHGGHFRTGGKSREARPLLHRLASQGWLCVSANYRLGRAGRFPHSLVDAKRVIAWVREHAAEHGADPSVVVVAGSSSGAHLASMAALTPNEPAFQPGFASADTSVSAAVCLYGYYGSRGDAGPLASSPLAYVRPDAPPFFIAHGDNDTLIPASSAAAFADALRRTSTSPVVSPQLPGAQHSFDLVHSLRFEHVVDGIAAFAAAVHAVDDHPVR